MKRFSLSLFVLVALFLLNAGHLPAKEDRATVDQGHRISTALNNYMSYLKSENHGLRNNAIYQIVQIKSRFPEADLSMFNKKLAKMALNDKEVMIRSHAFLALAYLNDDKLVEKVKLQFNNEEPEAFYERLDQQVHTEFWTNLSYEKNSGVYERLSLNLETK